MRKPMKQFFQKSAYTVGNIENVILTKNEAGEDTQCGTAEVTLTGKKNYTGEKR